MKPRTGTDEWSRKQKNCMSGGCHLVGAHPRPHFSVDERVFTVLKYTETRNVPETIRRFQKQVSELEDTVETNNKKWTFTII